MDKHKGHRGEKKRAKFIQLHPEGRKFFAQAKRKIKLQKRIIKIAKRKEISKI